MRLNVDLNGYIFNLSTNLFKTTLIQRTTCLQVETKKKRPWSTKKSAVFGHENCHRLCCMFDHFDIDYKERYWFLLVFIHEGLEQPG